MAKIGMIGAGSWGTALTWLLTNNGHQVTVWSALADEITMLQEKHEQTSKLPGVILDDSVVFTTDLKAAVEGMDLLVLAVPSPFTRSTAHQLKDVAAQGQIIVNVAKGVEENTLMTLSQMRFRRRRWQYFPVHPMQKRWARESLRRSLSVLRKKKLRKKSRAFL